MGDHSKIAWTDATLNTAYGCTKVSPACQNCYAIGTVKRLVGFGHEDLKPAVTPGWDSGGGDCYDWCSGGKEPTGCNTGDCGHQWTGAVVLKSERMDQARRWKKPRRVFVNSLSDTFHDGIPDSHLDALWATMAACPQHTFQILTKRPERMLAYITGEEPYSLHGRTCAMNGKLSGPWPLPNVWIGVTVEDQARADERIPLLLATPAAVRFVSMEPLLGPVDLTMLTYAPPGHGAGPWSLDCLNGRYGVPSQWHGQAKTLDWVIAGGESGPKARPMHPEWVMVIRDQCREAGVPFFFKQWGEWAPALSRDWNWRLDSRYCLLDDPDDDDSPKAEGLARGSGWMERVGKKAAGDLLDGQQHHEWPKCG